MPSFGNRIAALRELSAELDTFASKVGETTGEIGSKLDALVGKSDQFYHRSRQLEEDAAAAGGILDRLNGLWEQAGQTQNDWSLQFAIDIEQVRAGGRDLGFLITRWGDAVIATEKGFRTIREVMQNADLRQYTNQIQDLITGIDTGAADIEVVIKFLSDNAGTLASHLIEILGLFKEGKASLEDVERALESAKLLFPGVEFGGLADAITQGVLGGTL